MQANNHTDSGAVDDELTEVEFSTGGVEFLIIADRDNDDAWIKARKGTQGHAPFTDPEDGHVIRYNRHDGGAYK